jgi:VanZ family protein
MLRRLSLWAPPVLYAALIFYLSSRSTFPGVPSVVFDFDKVIHATEYGIFAALLLRATGSPWISLLIAALYGVSDEVHQLFVPGRDSSVFDALADTFGAGLVCLVWYVRQRRLRGTT